MGFAIEPPQRPGGHPREWSCLSTLSLLCGLWEYLFLGRLYLARSRSSGVRVLKMGLFLAVGLPGCISACRMTPESEIVTLGWMNGTIGAWRSGCRVGWREGTLAAVIA